MSRKQRRVLCFVVAWALLALSATTPCEAESGQINGKVVDGDGSPVAGVRVVLHSIDSGKELTSKTSKKGKFSMLVANAGHEFVIRLEKEGYQSIEEPIDPPPGSPLSLTWTLLPPTASSAGASTSEAANRLFVEGATAFEAGDVEGAVQKFQTALAEDPEMVRAYAALAGLYMHEERFEEAVQMADEVLTREPTNVPVLNVLCDAHRALGNVGQGEAAVDALMAVDDSQQTTFRVFNQGVAAAKAENLEAAARRFEQAIELDPTLTNAYGALAQLHLRRRAFDQVLAVTGTLLELEPDNETALMLRYDAYQAMGDDTNAEEAFEALQAAFPGGGAQLFYAQGVKLFNAGDMEQAKVELTHALAADPEMPEAYYLLGMAHANTGDKQAAIEHLSKFLELAPDNTDAPVAREMLDYLQ